MGEIEEFINEYYNKHEEFSVDDNILIIEGYCIWLDTFFDVETTFIELALFKTKAVYSTDDIILDELDTLGDKIKSFDFDMSLYNITNIVQYIKDIIYKKTPETNDSDDMDIRLLLI